MRSGGDRQAESGAHSQELCEDRHAHQEIMDPGAANMTTVATRAPMITRMHSDTACIPPGCVLMDSELVGIGSHLWILRGAREGEEATALRTTCFNANSRSIQFVTVWEDWTGPLDPNTRTKLVRLTRMSVRPHEALCSASCSHSPASPRH